MNLPTAVFELSAALPSQLPESDLPEIAFSGRSNVGKSSLINALLERKNLARTSSTPGKTATVNFYRLDTLRLVDLPGYGYAKVSKTEKNAWDELIQGYLDADRDLRLVIQLIDMRHPPTENDHLMMEYFADIGIPFVAVLTKADKLNKGERAAREAAIREELAAFEGLRTAPFSAVTKEGTETFRNIIDEVTG